MRKPHACECFLTVNSIREYRASLHQHQYPDVRAQIEMMNTVLKDENFVKALTKRLTAIIEDDPSLSFSQGGWQAHIARYEQS